MTLTTIARRTALAAAVLAAALAPAAPARAQEKDKDAAKAVLRLGTLAPEGSPWAVLLEKFKGTVEGATAGGVKVKLFFNGRQGDEPEMLEKTAAGKLDGGGFTSSGLSGVVPEMQVFELPFLFESDAAADAAMDDRDVKDEMTRRFEAKGLRLVCWAVNGWADLGATKGKATTLAEIKASKPWSRASGARKAFWTACGATPQSLPVTEVLAALKAGTVDVYETTPLFAAAAQWLDSTKAWTDSNHAYQPAALVVRQAWWASLPIDQQAKIEDAARTLQADARKAVRGLDKELLEGMQKRGIAIHPLAPEVKETVLKARPALVKELVAQGAFPEKLLARVEEVAKASKPQDPAAAAKERVAAHLAAADELHAQRPDASKLAKVPGELEEALKDDPKSFEATWRMARAYYALGRYGQEDKKIPRYEQGIEWAKKTIAMDEKRVEGHWWIAVLYGVYGEANGITSSLFLVGDMERALERAKQIDPSYDGAGPLRVLGRLLFKLPWAAGGSNKKSLENLRKAIEMAPEMPYNYTYLAETLIDEDEEVEARNVLNKLITRQVDPKWKCEFEEAKAEAQKLLQKLD